MLSAKSVKGGCMFFTIVVIALAVAVVSVFGGILAEGKTWPNPHLKPSYSNRWPNSLQWTWQQIEKGFLALAIAAMTVAVITTIVGFTEYKPRVAAKKADYQRSVDGVAWSLEQIEKCSIADNPYDEGWLDPQRYLNLAREVSRRHWPTIIRIDEAKVQRDMTACYIKIATRAVAFSNGTKSPPVNFSRDEWRKYAERNATQGGLSLAQIEK